MGGKTRAEGGREGTGRRGGWEWVWKGKLDLEVDKRKEGREKLAYSNG